MFPRLSGSQNPIFVEAPMDQDFFGEKAEPLREGCPGSHSTAQQPQSRGWWFSIPALMDEVGPTGKVDPILSWWAL